MTDLGQDVRDKIRRSIGQEFVRMEDDFDVTRDHRKVITDKLLEEAGKIKLTNEDGELTESADVGLRVYATALKALADSEKAASQSIILKLKNQEQMLASAQASRDRIEIVLKATAPGRIEADFPHEALEDQLEDMFKNDIKDFELKTSNRSLDE